MVDLVGPAKVSSWLVNIREQLGALTGPDGVPALDPAQTARIAHGLVSSAGMLGFTEASQACARLEAACLSGGDLAAAWRDAARARARALDVIAALEAGEARALSA
jgi:HPt (histidine-containing phosphotransfer) domain-containing protein